MRILKLYSGNDMAAKPIVVTEDIYVVLSDNTIYGGPWSMESPYKKLKGRVYKAVARMPSFLIIEINSEGETAVINKKQVLYTIKSDKCINEEYLDLLYGG